MFYYWLSKIKTEMPNSLEVRITVTTKWVHCIQQASINIYFHQNIAHDHFLMGLFLGFNE